MTTASLLCGIIDRLTLKDVSIKGCWNKGRHAVEVLIQNSTDENLTAFDFSELHENINILRPNGIKIGVTELAQDWSAENSVEPDYAVCEEIVNVNDDDDDQNLGSEEGVSEDGELDLDTNSSSLVSMLEVSEKGVQHDSQIDVDGSWFHKSTILKQTFVGTKVSKDRLRRVQGMSKYVNKKETSLNLDDILLLGDAVLYLEKNVPKLGSVESMKKGGRKVKMLKGDELHSENVFLSVKELEFEDDGTNHVERMLFLFFPPEPFWKVLPQHQA